jgi:cation diffusion facilitator family transporter
MSGHGHGCGHDHAPSDGTAKTVILNLSVNLVLTAAKWLAFALTGSPSLFGEAAHSTADSLNPIFLWIGYRRGKKPADDAHPLGHGRETYFWSLVAAIVMLVVGSLLTAWRGIETLVYGRAPDTSMVSLGIMLGALLMEGYTFARAWRELKREHGSDAVEKMKRSRNTVLLGVLLENFVDALGVILALIGYGLYTLTGNLVWDAACSLLIALVLLRSSLFLIGRSRSLLIGEGAPRDLVKKIGEAVAARQSVAAVVSVKAVTTGANALYCRVSLRLNGPFFTRAWSDDIADVIPYVEEPCRWTAAEVARELAAIEEIVRSVVPDAGAVDIKLLPPK